MSLQECLYLCTNLSKEGANKPQLQGCLLETEVLASIPKLAVLLSHLPRRKLQHLAASEETGSKEL